MEVTDELVEQIRQYLIDVLGDPERTAEVNEVCRLLARFYCKKCEVIKQYQERKVSYEPQYTRIN